MTRNGFRATALIIGLLLSHPTVASQAELKLTPVWSAAVRDGRLVVDYNDFPKDGTHFPFASLPIRMVKQLGEDPLAARASSIALVEFDSSGSVLHQSEYVPEWTVSTLPGEAPAFWGIGEVPAPTTIDPSAYVDFVGPVISRDAFKWWTAAPGREWALVRAAEEALCVTSSVVLGEVSARPVFPCFSRDGSRAAFVAWNTDERSTYLKADATSRVVVVDRNCRVVWETEDVAGEHFFFPYLSPAGEWLEFSVVSKNRDTHRFETVDLRLGVRSVHDGIPFGGRYYTADGRRMVMSHGSPISCYDFDSKRKPTLRWAYGDDRIFASVAVSGDGCYVAAVNRLETSEVRLTLLDGMGVVVGEYVDPTVKKTWGAMFRGEYLLLGRSEHPVPAYNAVHSTEWIHIFRVGNRAP